METVPQPISSRKSTIGGTGVLTINGFGVRVRMQSGHLEIEDGIGPERRRIRLARVGHGLRRLVMIGSDGFITFEALRWLADQSAAFAMLDRDGSVLATTGPVRPSDARLRRAQALAINNDNGIQLAVELISAKLTGQENVARQKLLNSSIADTIAGFRAALQSVRDIQTVLLIEANAALAYWSGWSHIPIQYPRKDLRGVPGHWQVFGARVSPLTGSPRLAVNPPNAALNYLYAVLGSEAHLAAAELGLDPGLGILHKDTPNRDSLACDLMEPVRPLVDAFVLDWLQHGPLQRQWFFEEANGNCRLMPLFATQLSETALVWRKAVAPYAEQAAKIFWQGRRKKSKFSFLPTRLTQTRRSLAKAGNLVGQFPTVPQMRPRCPLCGGDVSTGSTYCIRCIPDVNRENLLRQARLGRIVTHSEIAEARRAATHAKHVADIRKWNPSDLPKWLDEETYRCEILPRLSKFTVKAIRLALGVSHPYATLIKRGDRIPHPRHWMSLALLTGFQ